MQKYSDSSNRRRTTAGPLTLAIDSGSPVVSIALGAGDCVLAETSFPGGPSSPSLLQEIDLLLTSLDRRPGDIRRMIGARGPGSFTGLRTGLATLLGLHQALGVPATAVSSFLPLARQAPGNRRVVAAVDAMRGEWFAQPFETSQSSPSSPPAILPPDQFLQWEPCRVVAFGSCRITEALETVDPEHPRLETRGLVIQEAVPLAPQLLALAEDGALEWSPLALTSPLYLRPPAVTPQVRTAQ